MLKMAKKKIPHQIPKIAKFWLFLGVKWRYFSAIFNVFWLFLTIFENVHLVTLPKDIYAENEELKEEIQKLAGQIQYLKIVGMLMENRHIKPKRDGYFSKENCSKHFQHFLTRVYLFFKPIKSTFVNHCYFVEWDHAELLGS